MPCVTHACISVAKHKVLCVTGHQNEHLLSLVNLHSIRYLLTDPQSVLNRLKNFFNQVLNVHGIHDVRRMDIRTSEPLVPEPSLVEVEIAVGKLKRYKSPGTDQILAELIKAGGETLCSEIHRLIHSIWNKEELLQQCKESLIGKTVIIM
jgi:hypothetical protein